MKKIHKTKLVLNQQTLRMIKEPGLAGIRGGAEECPTRAPPCECCCGDSRISN